jgi:glycosyltransferase involved in cell wall biosynthesis
MLSVVGFFGREFDSPRLHHFPFTSPHASVGYPRVIPFMARVAIVSYDVQTIRGRAGGVGAFTTRLAMLLRQAGEDVTIVMTRTDWEPMSVDMPWKAFYQAQGVGLIELQSTPPLPTRWPEVPTMRVSELATPVLKNFDVVYLQDWGNAGFDLLRARRYRLDQGPVCVTVLHGPSEWELSSNEKYPDLANDLHLAYQERYCTKQSDFVVSPSAYMARHLTSLGWEFPGEVEVLGLPMPLPLPQTGPAPGEPKIKQIVYFGRIEERKGIRLFTLAMQRFAKQTAERPHVVLLGGVKDPELLEFAKRGMKSSGFTVSHMDGLDSQQAAKYLRDKASDTLCVVPSPSDNFPYAIVEASLVPGLNLIACKGGGVAEILREAKGQLSEPQPAELAGKILERFRAPLSPPDLKRYDCAAANERWVQFHHKALSSLQKRVTKTLPATMPTVDVVTTYYQKAPYLSQFVDALEHQTIHDFCVLAVNDGSPDEESNRVFAEQGERGAKHGWKFVRTENQWVDAARNSAAALGDGEFLLFLDSDDVPSMNAVERMREALFLSGDDALIASSYLFASDKFPWDLKTGATTAPLYALCIPLGVDLIGGIVDPSVFGGSMWIVRRNAFEALGGFTIKRLAGHEDWEIYIRLVLEGYKVDVTTDLLQFYRQVEGGVARLFGTDAARRRLLEPYEEKLRESGLGGAVLALEGLHISNRKMERQIKALEARLNAPQSGYSLSSKARQKFESEPMSLRVETLQRWFRSTLSLETRLKIHQKFLAPFVGQYKPPPPEA